MKKKLIAGMVVALVLAVALPMALAADSDTTPPPSKRPFVNFDRSQLDENELAELNALHDQMLNLRKQMILKYVEFGALSQEDADALIARIDEMAKWKREKGFVPGFGHGMFGHGMKGGKRGGKRGGFRSGKGTSATSPSI